MLPAPCPPWHMDAWAWSGRIRAYRSHVLRLAAIAALALPAFAVVQPATAEDSPRSFTVNGKTLRLPLPPDSCELDANVPRDRVLASLLDALDETVRELKSPLRRFANCSELTEWRAGRRQQIPDLVEIAEPARPSTAAERQEWLASLRGDRGARTAERVAAEWNTGDPAYPGAGTQRTPGVLLEPDRDDRALYEAFRARASLNGRTVELAGVTSWTMVAGQPLGLQTWAAWEGDGAIVGWLSEEQRDLVDRVLGVNGEERRRFVRAARTPAKERIDREERPRRDLMARYASEIAIGLIGAGLVLIAVGVIGSRVLRRRAA